MPLSCKGLNDFIILWYARVDRIKLAVREGRYTITDHAHDEAEQDDFLVTDVKHAMLASSTIKRLTHDPRGTRYALLGSSEDGRLVNVICRFDSEGNVRVITVYEEDGE